MYQFCNEDINKIALLLTKGFYPYENVDSWERFDETSFPDKKSFYSELYLEDITRKDYIHAQKVFKEFKIKNLSDHHDMYVRKETSFCPYVFETFRNKCIEIYEFDDPAHFFDCTWINMASLPKKDRIRTRTIIRY